MKNAVILHGGPSKQGYYDPMMPSESNKHWLPWLQRQLMLNDIPAATPEVPYAYDRNWAVWLREVERFDIGPETILVGHSTGAGFWIKYLSIHPELQVDKLILVAPWLDPLHEKTKDFFDDFTIDPQLASRTKGVTIFISEKDEDSVLKTVEIVTQQIKDVKVRQFPGTYGHFCYSDMHTQEFPELLAEVIA